MGMYCHLQGHTINIVICLHYSRPTINISQQLNKITSAILLTTVTLYDYIQFSLKASQTNILHGLLPSLQVSIFTLGIQRNMLKLFLDNFVRIFFLMEMYFIFLSIQCSKTNVKTFFGLKLFT